MRAVLIPGRRRALGICRFFLLFGLCLAGPRAVRAQALLPAGNVSQVIIRGLVSVPEDLVRGMLRTRPGRPATREQLEADVAALRELGFFEEVLPPLVEPTPEGPRVTFRVREFPRLLALEFAGNTLLSDAQLRAVIPLRVGQVFNARLLDESVAAIERAYRERGYVAAVTGDGLEQLRATGVLRLTIQELRVRQVRVEGLRRTQPEVVRRLLQLREGELFNEAALAADARRLRQLGLFEQVAPEVDVVAPGQAAVLWRLNERRARDLRLGFSYAPQDQAVGTVEYADLNFRGRAERLRVLGLVGSVDARAGGIVEYFNPWIADPGVTLLLRGFSEPRYRFARSLIGRDGTDRYFERRLGGQALTTFPRGQRSEVTLGARFEDVSVSGLPLGRLTVGEGSADGQVALLRLGATADLRDDPLEPFQGAFTSATLEGGLSNPDSRPAGGLARVLVDHRRYLPLRLVRTENGRRLAVPVLALRAVGGTSLGDLPFFEQYFLGGLGGLRGYREDRFWGEHLVAATAELRWPLASRITGVLFLDAGDAWGSRFQFRRGVRTPFRQHRHFSPRVGYGVGLRFATPVGPARLDLGIGEAVRLHFAVGAEF